MSGARRLRVTGTVQGVGFRPFVARLASAHALTGWVRNDPRGVDIHIEGHGPAINAFEHALAAAAPEAARIDTVLTRQVDANGFETFSIRASARDDHPSAAISPDLPLCDDCLAEMSDPDARRFGYPYISCASCGPRFSIVHSLPYDRARTAMATWPLCDACATEYHDPLDRRFHAESIACPQCGPRYHLVEAVGGDGGDPISRAAALLGTGAVVALKGIGGYHLSCDATNAAAVHELRHRKFRKAKPFAIMARDLEAAATVIEIDAATTSLLTSAARPIVLASARVEWPEVAPGHRELGVMLPYAPIHHLLFAAGAPAVLVMTSANRSSEPIVFQDSDARHGMTGLADALLVGERAIVRPVEDSIVRVAPGGAVVLRRGRGYAPGTVARLPADRPILAVGADLKNAVALVIDGKVVCTSHLGDLEQAAAYTSFQAAVHDLMKMYEVNPAEVTIAHDLHPHFLSTAHALSLPAARHVAVQHHRAHVASVLAEEQALDEDVVGIAFDGTGYGDDGTIWGGEFFVGSVTGGLCRVASLRPFVLPGADAAARHPVQAAAGVLFDLEDLPDLTLSPFCFPPRYRQARQLAKAGLRTIAATSAGRVFDAAAALLGFTAPIEYEGHAAVWLEELAASARATEPLPFTCDRGILDFRPAMRRLIERRLSGDAAATLARAFHETVALGIASVAVTLCRAHRIKTIVVSGGTFQNALLLSRLRAHLDAPLQLWTNHVVPPNDGGISLGQAAIACFADRPSTR